LCEEFVVVATVFHYETELLREKISGGNRQQRRLAQALQRRILKYRLRQLSPEPDR